MKVLVLGGDGRTHAIASKLLSSPLVTEIVCSPGNGGTAPLIPMVKLDETNVADVGRWAFDEMFDLIVPTGSASLRAGLVDEVLSLQVGVCGPPKRAAEFECSRCRTKEFLVRHNLPTAQGRAFGDLATAEKYLATLPLPVIIKSDVPDEGERTYDDRFAALEGLRDLFQLPGNAARGLVVESFLKGARVAFSVLTDGRTAVPFLPVRLYDRVEEGDVGLCAAGVGAHTSHSQFARQLGDYLLTRLIKPVIAGIERDNLPYWGILGIDCIITAEGPRITALRSSMREGEAQVVFPRLEDDLLPYIQAAITRRLHELPAPRWNSNVTVGIGLIARGYPNNFRYGGSITGLETLDDGILTFHSSTANPMAELPYTLQRDRGLNIGKALGGLLGMRGISSSMVLHTTGGLVMTIVGQGATLAGARGRALINAERVQFESRTFRTDIAAKEFG